MSGIVRQLDMVFLSALLPDEDCFATNVEGKMSLLLTVQTVSRETRERTERRPGEFVCRH